MVSAFHEKGLHLVRCQSGLRVQQQRDCTTYHSRCHARAAQRHVGGGLRVVVILIQVHGGLELGVVRLQVRRTDDCAGGEIAGRDNIWLAHPVNERRALRAVACHRIIVFVDVPTSVQRQPSRRRDRCQVLGSCRIPRCSAPGCGHCCRRPPPRRCRPSMPFHFQAKRILRVGS